MVKEFFAVVFQLVCYSRLNSFDLFTGPLILYVTLVVFSFPFLNPYLFAVLRLGPWNTGEAWVATLCQTLSVAAAQCAGGVAAAVISKGASLTWPDAMLVQVGSIVNGTGKNAGVIYNDSLSENWSRIVVIEEFAAVLALLVGVIHLVECHAGSLLKNRPRVSSLVAQETYRPNVSAEDTIVPVPSELVFQVCVLVAGILCAFPSAHQALHVSVFIGVSGAKFDWWRLLGGVLATAAGVLYYYFIYVWSVDQSSGSHRVMQGVRDPAYFYSRFADPESAGLSFCCRHTKPAIPALQPQTSAMQCGFGARR